MTNLRNPCLCLAFVLCQFMVEAQQYPMYRLTSRDGLPNQNVFRLMQDSKGALWMSTEAGVCRYDGVNIESFSRGQGLKDNSVIHTREDALGQIWAGYYHAGMHKLSQGRFEPAPLKQGVWPRYIIKSVHADNSDWCLNVTSLFRVRNDTLKPASVPWSSKIIDLKVWGKDTLLVSTESGLFIREPASDWKPFSLLPDSVVVTAMHPDQNKVLWVAHKRGVIRIQGNTLTKVADYAFPTTPDHMVVAKDQTVWISNFKSLFRLSENRVEDVTASLATASANINDMIMDDQQNLWLATYGNGVVCVPTDQVKNYLADDKAIKSPVNAIGISKGHVLAASLGVLAVLKNEGFEVVASNYHQNHDYPYFIEALDLGFVIGNHNHLFKMAPTNEGDAWEEEVVYPINASTFLVAANGDLWLGNFAGLMRDCGSGFVQIETDSIGYRVEDIQEWKNGIVIATDSGLYYRTENRLMNLRQGKAEAKSFFYRVHVDSQGRLWAASKGQLFVFDGDPASDLSCDLFSPRLSQILDLAESNDGELWAGTETGLVRIAGGSFQRFGMPQGLIASQVRAIAIDSLGNIWTATPSGISFIQNTQLQKKRPFVKMCIKAVSYDSSFIEYPQHVQLSTASQNIHASFFYPRFPYLEERSFEYQLAGLQNEWFKLEGQVLQLASLPAGDFVLKVRHVGTPEEEWAQLPFTVTAPYYEQLWFRILLFAIGLCALVAVILFIFNRRERQIRMKLKQGLDNALLRAQALQAMVSPHFIFNSLNAVLSLVDSKRQEDVEDYVTNLSDLLRGILERGNQSTISIKEEVDLLTLYLHLEQIRYGSRLQFEVRIHNSVNQSTKIPSMLLQPFVENAVQHGIAPQTKGGKVEVIMEEKEQSICITVRDNGVGINSAIKNSDHPKSLGISLITQRLELMEKVTGKPHRLDIKDRSPQPGTDVKLVLGKT